jgi:putative hydrolase of the HAD superfamily
MTKQFLIIDADDTLWENNIYFERAFDEFVDFLDHSSLTPHQVRDVLDEIEDANARLHGYGTLNFARNLRQCYERLAERAVCAADIETVEEQKLKIESSGLRGFFAHTAIVKEKDAAAYRDLVETRGMDSRRTWMIGNSPKSDINPALEAGLNAVFVPHAHTWVLEKQEIRPGNGTLLKVARFSDLRAHF